MIDIDNQKNCMNDCWEVYDKFKINFYKSVCKQIDNSEDKLTMLEAITLEVIDILDEPTVNDVARFLEISQPNAAYKVGTLEKKGYLSKVQSTTDRREYHVILSDKYDEYADLKNNEINKVFCRLASSYTEEEREIYEKIFSNLHEAMDPMIVALNEESED